MEEDNGNGGWTTQKNGRVWHFSQCHNQMHKTMTPRRRLCIIHLYSMHTWLLSWEKDLFNSSPLTLNCIGIKCNDYQYIFSRENFMLVSRRHKHDFINMPYDVLCTCNTAYVRYTQAMWQLIHRSCDSYYTGHVTTITQVTRQKLDEIQST